MRAGDNPMQKLAMMMAVMILGMSPAHAYSISRPISMTRSVTYSRDNQRRISKTSTHTPTNALIRTATSRFAAEQLSNRATSCWARRISILSSTCPLRRPRLHRAPHSPSTSYEATISMTRSCPVAIVVNRCCLVSNCKG